MKVLGVTARSDGELVADLIEIPVTCQLEHEVRIGRLSNIIIYSVYTCTHLLEYVHMYHVVQM